MPKVKKAIKDLNSGMNGVEVQKLIGLHPNIISKIRKTLFLIN